jgi:hypothetical protein
MLKLYSTLLLFILLPLFGMITVSASPNIGLLRVSGFLCPREVVPGATFPVSLDIEYAIQNLPDEATIRGAVYEGSMNSGSPLWQSDPTLVSNGGDQVWNFTLTAPATEGFFNLTAYAFFLNDGTWSYFNNPVNGPGVSQRSIKIGKTANLEVNTGASDIAVTVDGTIRQTSTAGVAIFQVAVGSSASVSVPPLVELQNSTRIIFTQWGDGVAEPERQVPIDGDANLTAQYRIQYLLTVSNSSKVEEWYDRGTNVTLTAPTSASSPWPLSIFGVTETFQGWSGDIRSTSPQINVTMDSPKTITAEMTADFRPLVMPTILGAGISVAIISFVLILRSRSTEENVTETPIEQPVPESNLGCPKCGQPTEPEWAHCIKCGSKLRDANSSTSQVDS